MNDTTVAAIDFETAASFRASACAVGVSIPTGDGQPQSRSWLIRPPGNHYDPFNISIHGITPEDTENAPRIHEMWNEVADFIGDRTLIAHNAAFDMSVLRHSFANRGAPVPREYEYLCTYLLARSVWPTRYSYRLNDIVTDLGLDASRHHDPAWDAAAALEVANSLTQDLEVETLREVAAARGYSIGQLSSDPNEWIPFSNSMRSSSGSRTKWKASDIQADPGALDEDHPLYGQRIVITGALPNGMGRKEAYQRVVNVGGEVASGVSKKVNILVVAELNPTIIGEDGKSGKLRKAIDFAESGVDIELMDSREFLRLLGTDIDSIPTSTRRYSRDKVYERDGWRCALCGVSLATGVPKTHGLAPAIDRRDNDAIASGVSNVQAAHRRCRATKSRGGTFDPATESRGPGIVIPLPEDFLDSALARLREENPDIDQHLAALEAEREAIPEIQIPHLKPERVGPLYDEAVELAEAYADAIAASDEVPDIVANSIEETDDEEDACYDTMCDLLDVASMKLGEALEADLPEVAGLAPVWGLRPFREGDWPMLAGVFLDYVDAGGTFRTAIETVLVESGHESRLGLGLRRDRHPEVSGGDRRPVGYTSDARG